jgi:hypothetical protein
MSKRLQAPAMALGLTSICMAWLISPLVSPRHATIYHWSGSASTLFGTAFVAVLIAWAALTLLLLSIRSPGWWRKIVWLVILLYVPWIAVLTLYSLRPPQWLPLPAAVLVLFAWDFLVVIWAIDKRLDPLIEFSSTVLVFLAISGVLCLGEMAWFWWSARSLNDPRPLHQAQKVMNDDPKPRILWIVFDELSYEQVYERRYPGLELPAFDALATEATVFTHTVPEGIRTEAVFPALMTGEPIDDIRSSADGQLSMHNSKTKRWERFEQQDTVFQRALEAGYGTAIVGWYNPYCRMMPAVLERCFTTGDSSIGIRPDGTPWSNLRGSFGVLLTGLPWSGQLHVANWLRVPDHMRKWDGVDYERIAAAGDEVLADRSATFALLHLPIPHPPGIYDRRTGQLTTGSATYIDNLALADRYLAHVRSVLERNGQWDSSTVVLMGDHSWRTRLLWEDSFWWTDEEQRASNGGKFDDRPAYIVKLAGQHAGVRIDAPFQALETHDLLDALMTGTIRSAEDLQTWVRQSGGEPTASQGGEKGPRAGKGGRYGRQGD